MNRMVTLRGYDAVRMYGDGTAGYSIETGITQGTNLFKSIFDPLVQAKSEKDIKKLSIQDKQLDNELQLLLAEQAKAQTEGAKAQLALAVQELELQKANLQEQQIALSQRVQTEGKTLSPMGYAVVGGGVLAVLLLVSGNKKRR